MRKIVAALLFIAGLVALIYGCFTLYYACNGGAMWQTFVGPALMIVGAVAVVGGYGLFNRKD